MNSVLRPRFDEINDHIPGFLTGICPSGKHEKSGVDCGFNE